DRSPRPGEEAADSPCDHVHNEARALAADLIQDLVAVVVDGRLFRGQLRGERLELRTFGLETGHHVLFNRVRVRHLKTPAIVARFPPSTRAAAASRADRCGHERPRAAAALARRRS